MSAGSSNYQHWSIGVVVTGRAEEAAFATFLGRSVANGMSDEDHSKGRFHVRCLRFAPQLGPRKARPGTPLRTQMVERTLTTRQAELALTVRSALLGTTPGGSTDFVVFVDDLEHAQRATRREKFDNYRTALDRILPDELRPRASVHFLVNMMEAYFFADAEAFERVFGIPRPAIRDFGSSEPTPTDDPEDIRHPKNELERLFPTYSETGDGAAMLASLDARRVLSDPATCASLRTLFAWCWKAMGLEPPSESDDDVFRLRKGKLSPVTSPQIARLAARSG